MSSLGKKTDNYPMWVAGPTAEDLFSKLIEEYGLDGIGEIVDRIERDTPLEMATPQVVTMIRCPGLFDDNMSQKFRAQLDGASSEYDDLGIDNPVDRERLCSLFEGIPRGEMLDFLRSLQATELYEKYGIGGVLDLVFSVIGILQRGPSDCIDALGNFVDDFEALGVADLSELISYLELLDGLGCGACGIENLAGLAVHLDFDKVRIRDYLEFAEAVASENPCDGVANLPRMFNSGIYDPMAIEKYYRAALDPINPTEGAKAAIYRGNAISFASDLIEFGVDDPDVISYAVRKFNGLGTKYQNGRNLRGYIPYLLRTKIRDLDAIVDMADGLLLLCDRYQNTNPLMTDHMENTELTVFMSLPRLIEDEITGGVADPDRVSQAVLGKLDGLLMALSQLRLGRNEESMTGFYYLVFNADVFGEAVSDVESREKLLDMTNMMGADIGYISANLEGIFYNYLEAHSGNAGDAIGAMHRDMGDSLEGVRGLFSSTGAGSKRAELFTAVFRTSVLDLRNIKAVLNKLKRAGFTPAETIDLILRCRGHFKTKDIMTLIGIALDVAEVLNIRPDRKTMEELIYETLNTEMNRSILMRGAEVLNILCEDRETISKLAENYGGALFQVLYLLSNSWQAEADAAGDGELKCDEAITRWMNRERARDKNGLLESILNLCQSANDGHGIRYWGRYSLNTLRAIADGETKPESALIITTRDADENGAFYPIYRDLELLNRRGANLIVLEVDREGDIYASLDNRLKTLAARDLPLFSTMYIAAHGFSDVAVLGRGDGEECTIDRSDWEWKKYVPLFKDNASILFKSCFVGKGLISRFGEFLSGIPGAKFRGALDLVSSELKEDPKTGNLYLEYNNGEAGFIELRPAPDT